MHRILIVAYVLNLCAVSYVAKAETSPPRSNEFLELNCQDIDRSSFIERLCYDEDQDYMLVRLSGRLYHYCNIEPEIFRNFLSAPSMGEFYNAHIRGREVTRPYDCRK